MENVLKCQALHKKPRLLGKAGSSELRSRDRRSKVREDLVTLVGGDAARLDVLVEQVGELEDSVELHVGLLKQLLRAALAAIDED